MIILTQLIPQATNRSFLRLHSSKIRSTSTSSSTKSKLRTIILPSLLKMNSKLFSSKFFENSLRLWPVSGLKLRKILNISKKKFNTRLFIYNILNPSWWNLTWGVPQPKKYYVNIFMKVSDPLLGYGLMKNTRTWMLGMP